MRFGRRDLIATVCVVAGVLVYALWAANHPLPGLSSVRVVALFVLGTGVAASASAVVPSFTQLLHGSKMYMAVTSLVGAVALVAGIMAIFRQTDVMLHLLVATTVALWIIATVRHTLMDDVPDGSHLAS
jgi:hypothetical protein